MFPFWCVPVEQNELSVCDEGQANRFISFSFTSQMQSGETVQPGYSCLVDLGLFGTQSFHVGFVRVSLWTCFADGVLEMKNC